MLGLRSKKETEFVLYYAEKLELKSHFTLNWKSKTPKETFIYKREEHDIRC